MRALVGEYPPLTHVNGVRLRASKWPARKLPSPRPP